MVTRFAGTLILALMCLVCGSCQKENDAMRSEPDEAIKHVIETAYIQGIHTTQDRDLVLKGFHKDFRMLVLNDNAIDNVDVDEWLARIAKMKAENPELWNAQTTYQFAFVDATGNAAVAKLDVYKGQTHYSTDYMLLYQFDEGWKIVSKVFNIPKN